MFLFRVMELLGLMGLMLQAFVSWIFVAILAALKRPLRGPLKSFHRAFLVLAIGLTLMSFRFFRAHDVQEPPLAWQDGHLVPTLIYGAYMALKVGFAYFLVRGCHQLVDTRQPRALASGAGLLAVAFAALPFAVPGVVGLLLWQAPVMVAASLLALHAMRKVRPGEFGMQVVQLSLVLHACAWVLHAAAALEMPGLQRVLHLNSVIDLGVEVLLGIGLIVSVVQDSNWRLRQSEKEREKLRESIARDHKLRALGAVVSGVAHELNNPLTVILGHAEILRRREPESPSARVIAEQAERCRGIVRNLSALAGQSVHPRASVDVAELVRRVVRGLDPDLMDGGRTVRIAPMHGLCCIADRIGLEQVLANLLQNALQACPSGGTVTVEAGGVGEDVEILVRDEGPGVPLELRERLFEPFFTTKAPGQGTGLGLSIAHAIVRAHRGSIAIEDAPFGPGALFRVRLPQGTTTARTPTPKFPRPDADARTRPRLLIVDDEPALRNVLRVTAEEHGWTVDEAGSAEEALDGPLERADAVLCDLRMPGLGGAGLHDRVAEQAPERLGSFVFFTGDLASPEAVEFSRRCARPLMQKPLDFDELFGLLAKAASARVLTPRQSAGSSASSPKQG